MKRTKAEVRNQPAADAIPFEVQEQVLGDVKDHHYRKWLDEPLPALRGRTPREAVRLKTWRPRVADLLKDLEVAEARAGQRGQPRYDAA